MERNAILRWVLIAAGLFLFFKFGWPMVGGKGHDAQPVPQEQYVNAPGFAPDKVDPVAAGAPPNPAPPEGELCTLRGDRYKAELSTRGASLVHFYINDAQYADVGSGEDGFDVSTTPDHERWRSLRTLFRSDTGHAAGADDQLAYDRFDWKLEKGGAAGSANAGDERTCVFSFEDASVKLTKTVSVTDRPFELEVATTVENLAETAKKHTLQIGTFAYRKNKDVKGSLGRVSPFLTELMCVNSDALERKGKDDFKNGPFTLDGTDRFAAVTNYYFGQALIPAAGDRPQCWMLAEHWFAAGQDPDDDEAAAIYHAKLVYPEKQLAPHEVATYTQTAFFGPKERNVLAAVGGGRAKLGDLINLGFFSPVAKYLVMFMVFLHDHVTHNWGFAIILLTVCLRLVMFPLSLKQIRTTIGMRKLKPELDELTKKFKGDAQAKNLATMELYRKRGVNPLGGCLPQLVQMPVWWAMYTTLQTAVEMYHRPFLWFKDLSIADPYYILPIVLGGLGFMQARIMPQQPGQDPAQQKMMMYLMPAIFTAMMLFLPAALGVYMMTNSALGILQQVLVEQYAKRNISSSGDGDGGGGIIVKDSTSAAPKALKS